LINTRGEPDDDLGRNLIIFKFLRFDLHSRTTRRRPGEHLKYDFGLQILFRIFFSQMEFCHRVQ
jgi:hypothetical protein